MRVSQRLDHTVRAIVLLAIRNPVGYASGAELAAGLHLPQRVVEQQLSALARAGLLQSKPGAGGGFSLARPASAISLADVVDAVQPGLVEVPLLSGSVVTEAWADMRESVRTYLAGVTIADLARRQSTLDAHAADTYWI